MSNRNSFFTAPGEVLALQGQEIEYTKLRMSLIGSSKEETHNQISTIKKSFIKDTKSTSIGTIFAITNSMVGSVCLIIPQSFQQSGIILSTLIMFIICLISLKTCSLYVRHTKSGETDISDLIKRVLGKKWSKVFCVSSFLLMFLVGNIYFLLINSTLYPLICFILKKTHLQMGEQYYDPQGDLSIVFNMFSVQWLSIILILLVSPFLFIKNIRFIVKLAHGGFFAIVLYVFFIIYIFVENIYSGNLQKYHQDVNYFSADVAGISGNFALAFMIHNAILQIMSTNTLQKNNQRDLSIGYIIAFVIYGLIGIFGSFGIVGRKHPDKPSTIAQYFDSDTIPPFIIELFFSGHLITAFPLFNFISKIQFFNLFSDTTPIPKWANYLFNITFACTCLILQIFNTSPGIVIGITGAIVGFLIVYALPILVHLQCTKNESDCQKVLIDKNGFEQSKQEAGLKQSNQYFRIAFYIFLNIIGLYLGVIQLVQIFQ